MQRTIGSQLRMAAPSRSTCCSVTAKQAKRVAVSAPETEVSIVSYRDFRTYARALEQLSQELRDMGLPFLNGEVTSVVPADEGLAVQVELLGSAGASAGLLLSAPTHPTLLPGLSELWIDPTTAIVVA